MYFSWTSFSNFIFFLSIRKKGCKQTGDDQGETISRYIPSLVWAHPETFIPLSHALNSLCVTQCFIVYSFPFPFFFNICAGWISTRPRRPLGSQFNFWHALDNIFSKDAVRLRGGNLSAASEWRVKQRLYPATCQSLESLKVHLYPLFILTRCVCEWMRVCFSIRDVSEQYSNGPQLNCFYCVCWLSGNLGES